MGSSDYSGEDDKNEVLQMQLHPDRVGADPTEGWRRGARGALRKSCDTCTSSKTKCCGSIPCDRCKKRRIECKFSKRRRCGPKARLEDEKRARTGPSDDSEDSGEKMGSHEQHSSPLLSPLRTVYLGNPPPLPGGVALSLPESLKGAGLAAPLTTDGLTGLVELIAPSLSDGGGSGSSGGSCGDSSAYPRMTSAHTAPTYAQQEPPPLPINSGNSGGADSGGGSASVGAVSFLSAEPAPAQHGSGASSVRVAVPPGEPPGAPGGPAPPSSILPSSATAAREILARQASIRSARRLTASHSAPTPGLACLPPRGLPPRSSSSGTAQTGTAAGRGCFEGPTTAKAAFFQEAAAAAANGGLRRWVEDEGLVAGVAGSQQQPAAPAAAPAAPAPPALPRRGALPMELEARPKAHLRTFMRTVGSVLLLAGTDALRDATFDDNSEEEMPQARSPTAGPTATGPTGGSTAVDSTGSATGPTAGGGGVGTGPFRAFGETKRFDPMEGAEEKNDKTAVSSASATAGSGDATRTENGSARGAAGGGGEGGGGGGKGGDENVFAQACRAEAWAAVAIGGLFSGAGEEEGNLYASRAVEGLSGCLDAPLPEVASTMILLTLFWMHSMDTRKVERYFGFAQQVGLELGPLMPSGLRHTIAFVSVMVTMTLNLHKHPSIALVVRDHTVWGVTLQKRPGADPFIAALATITVACSKMLQDEADKSRGVLDVDVPPSQSLTDMLGAAVESLTTTAVEEGDQNPDHMLTILHGLKGYTHVARDEVEDAEASAKLALGIIDRHPAVLHLPLTFTLAEASRRLVQQPRIGRPARRLGLCADALRVARAGLAFARPTAGAAAQEVVGGDDHGVGKGKIGGWCTFGDAIMGAFDKRGGGGGGEVSAEANSQGDRPVASRTGSMSPPPKRLGSALSRADIASQHWAPSTNTESSSSGGSRRPRNGAGSPTLQRWHVPSPAAEPSGPTHRGSGLSNPDAPSDWVDRVRKMPVANARPSSPNIVQRLGDAPDPRMDGSRSLSALSLLGPGTMPSGAPNQAARYVSEPDGLTLLSGVAAPYNSMPRRTPYHEDRNGGEREAGRRGGGGSVVRFDRSVIGGGGGERDADDLPPPANPTMSAGVSFDPNREDPSFPFLA